MSQLRREWVQSGNFHGCLTMTGESLLQFVVPAILAIVWLIRLEGNQRTADKMREAMETRFNERLDSERRMRETVEQRINGFEARIWEKLDNIESLLHKKADR